MDLTESGDCDTFIREQSLGINTLELKKDAKNFSEMLAQLKEKYRQLYTNNDVETQILIDSA